MTSEAQHWYEMAAKNGSIYAMIQLGRKSDDLCNKLENCPASTETPAAWLTNAKNLTIAKANDGDAESSYLMYEITLDEQWLEKSANAGYPLAQYWMAVNERQGEGFFLIPGKREASVKRWLMLSSEGGNPKAMMDYLEILYAEGDMESVAAGLKWQLPPGAKPQSAITAPISRTLQTKLATHYNWLKVTHSFHC
jgi:TPR repeat protein